ncbi:heat shock factor protein 1-like isoform X4 [Crassostrea angulata]|uniref:Heat shock transcription factor 1a n=1 Tax=Magallana gigas TaxID=29159 RepID=F8WKQ0_MAGGI|nr:heat shock factor protein 1-like isoform X4 [Crassostrea angulata]BAK61496.1 heat shock transcription factor 1a [Crassostrea gigas]
MGSNPVPAFLTKLWALVENPTCDDLICWDESGKSFHVFDQGRFAKEILPLYFKHSNIASFIRQLNMYGFRKVTNIEQGLKTEKDDLEFQHPYFQKDQEQLLEHIKRKITHHVPAHPQIKVEPIQTVSVPTEDLSRMVSEVNQVKSKQDMMNNKLETMKKENEVLWREVASLRQKHMKQTQIVNKLIQFLVHLVGANRVAAASKRKMPLMIGNSTSPKVARYNKSHIPLDIDSSSYCVESPDSFSNYSSSNGPVIHDITDLQENNQRQNSGAKKDSAVLDLSHLNLPSDIITPGHVPDTSGVKDDLTLFNGDLLSDSSTSSDLMPKMMSMSDLGRMGNVPTSVNTKPTNTVASPGSEMSDHVESVSSDLEGLKDLLAGSNYFDPNLLLGMLAGLDSFKTDDGSNSGPLVHYKQGDEEIPDLFDLAEMSKDEHEDEASKISLDQINKSKALDTPLPIQISADDLD